MGAKLKAIRNLDDLVALWPTQAEFARDLGVKPSHFAVMKVRGGRIASDYWPTLIAAAKRRHADDPTKGFDRVNAELMLALQERAKQTAA